MSISAMNGAIPVVGGRALDLADPGRLRPAPPRPPPAPGPAPALGETDPPGPAADTPPGAPRFSDPAPPPRHPAPATPSARRTPPRPGRKAGTARIQSMRAPQQLNDLHRFNHKLSRHRRVRCGRLADWPGEGGHDSRGPEQP